MSFDDAQTLETAMDQLDQLEDAISDSEPILAGNGACPFCDCHAFIPSPGDDTKCGRSNCGHRWVDHY